MALTQWLETNAGADYLTVTPDLARTLLQDQLHNRPIDEGKVGRLLATLRRRARGASEPIIGWPGRIVIREDGRLTDGQHRLSAVVRYGAPVVVRVAWVPADFDREPW